jgi:chitinase
MRRRSGMGAWKYDPAGQRFYSIDDASVMAEKAAWVVSPRAGGVAAWELSGDTPDAELLAALRSGLSA